MRKILLTLSLLLITIMSQAQTIHWLTFIDTRDDRVGEVDVLGRKVLYGRYVNLINAALASKGYTAKIYDYFDTRLSPENCKAAIQNLRCQPNDIIMFYYIGHGGRAINDNSTVYPQMCMGQSYDDKMIPLTWVYNQLKAKGARLNVVIGMCCNSETRGMTSKMAPSFSPNEGNTYMANEEAARIQELCLNYKGNILVTSASPKQTSGCCESELGLFDTYTNVLVHVFDDLMKGKLQPTWDALLATTKATVNEVMRSKQTPIYEIHVDKATVPQQTSRQEAPKPSKAEEPTQTKQENSKEEKAKDNSTEQLLNELASIYDFLANTSNSEEKRIDLEQALTNSYGKIISQVKVLSQDNDFVVDKESFEDFNSTIATSRRIRKVIPLGFGKGINGKAALYVQEIYKK